MGSDDEILDTPVERSFEDIVNIASQVCGKPMALISLIDDRRQFLKAAVGFDIVEASGALQFCDAAIQQPASVFEVGDAAGDARFRDNPSVAGAPNLRFFASAPLRTPAGPVIGTLSVLSGERSSLTPAQRSALEALGRQLAIQLELRRALRSLRTSEHVTASSERRTRRAQAAGGIGAFQIELPGGQLSAAPQFFSLFGLSPSDGMTRAKVTELILRDDLMKVAPNGLDEVLSAPLNVEYRVRRADTGEIRWLARRAELELDAEGQPVRMVGVIRDITDEHLIHANLVESEAQARASVTERNFIVDLIAAQRSLTDPEQVMRASAQALGRRLGISRASFYRLSGSSLLQYAAGWSDGGLKALRGQLAADAFGVRAERARRVGDTLIFSDSRHDAVGGLDSLADMGVLSGICLSNHDGNRWQGGLSIHHAFVRAWSVSEIALAKEVAELTWLAVERAEAMVQLEQRIGQQDDTIVQTAGKLQSEFEARNAAEDQVRQLQKMEAVGQLTGGIAHDFNNMLAVVIGALNLMGRRLARGETDLKKYLDAAMDGADRAAALTQRLLAFARQQPLAPEPLDANRLVAGLTDLLTRTLGERVQLETVLSAGLWKIHADPNQLENVVVNLATNARDAMGEGGKLTIETNNAHVDSEYAQAYGIPVGQYILICVSDTGTGMPPDVLAKAFEPFFTTKGVGKGTGLGLSQVFGFIRQSGGHIKVYSEPGHGTSVKIYLPRYFGVEQVPVRNRGKRPAKGGATTEIILVVEDDKRVQTLSVEALRELGYTVLHADTGAEALRLIENGQAVSLLFTDIVMPEMTGRQLADRATKLQPHLKVVFTTGYTRNAVVHNGVIDPGTHFLPKPFNIDDLGRIVRRALDEDL